MKTTKSLTPSPPPPPNPLPPTQSQTFHSRMVILFNRKVRRWVGGQVSTGARGRRTHAAGTDGELSQTNGRVNRPIVHVHAGPRRQKRARRRNRRWSNDRPNRHGHLLQAPGLAPYSLLSRRASEDGQRSGRARRGWMPGWGGWRLRVQKRWADGRNAGLGVTTCAGFRSFRNLSTCPACSLQSKACWIAGVVWVCVEWFTPNRRGGDQLGNLLRRASTYILTRKRMVW